LSLVEWFHLTLYKRLFDEDETKLKISMEVTTCMDPILEEDYPEHTTLLVFDPWGTHTTKLPKVEIQLT